MRTRTILAAAMPLAALATPIRAQVPRVDFATGVVHEIQVDPENAFGGDFDGDGKLDVLVVQEDGVDVHRGDGAGRLDPTPIRTLVPNVLEGIVLDATEDGILDVALYASPPARVIVLRGNGDGSFTPIATVTPVAQPEEIAAGDVDADGHFDLALATPEGVRLLLGDGTGQFPRNFLHAFSPPTSASSVALADLDEDGHLDWAATTPDTRALRVAFGDGAGGVLRTTSQTFTPEVARVVLADLDVDGHVDAVVGVRTFERYLATLRGDGTGALALVNFVWPTFRALGIAVADLDGDARPELIVQHDNGRGLVVARAVSPLVFQPTHQFFTISDPFRPVIGDYDGDGVPDVAAMTDSSLVLFRGRGDATLVAPRQVVFVDLVRSPLAIDVNSDGLLDVVAARAAQSDVMWMLGDGAGGLGAISRILLSFGPTRIFPTDFDLDGITDLVVTNGSIALTRGTGSNFFNQWTQPFSADADLTVGDVNADGMDDIVTISSGRYRTHLGTGGPAYSAAIESATGSSARSIALADFDGDGLLDAAIGKSAGTYDVMASRGNGDGTFFGAFAYSSFEPNNEIFAGDFDGDGAVDLGAYYFDDSRDEVDAVRVFFGDGDMGFSAPVSFSPGTETQSVRAADVDGDGRPEIVATGEARRLEVYFENGSRELESSPFVGFFDALREATPGDFDGDGSTDFVTIGSNAISVVLNRTADLPENSVRRGNVNAAAGPVTDVLFVNGRKGLGDARRMRVDPDELFQIRMKSPPALGDGPAEYALFAWVGTAGPTSIEPAPGGYGPIGMPFASVRRRWNNTGDPLFGAPDFPSTPATATVMRRPNGLRKRLTAYLQGVIEDPASPSGVYAVTNGIEVVSR